ncbi:MAG: Gfo/Idh/MocA family oxidoreductase [Candidatus Bathyarchaeia archaeon]
MSRQIGVAVVGYGFMGTTHLTAWSMIPEAKVLAVVGRDRAKAEKVARGFNAAAYSSLTRALEEQPVDVVDVCTPTFTHRDYALEAIKAEKHVLVEKPMALSLREADEMIQAAEAKSVKLMVAHVLRFFAEYVKARELVQRGVVGRPVMVKAKRVGSMPPWGAENWFIDPSKSGGVAVDLAIHDIDFLRWCLQDEVERVFALTHRRVSREPLVDDHALILLRFRGGVVAHVEASWAMPQALPFTTSLEVRGPSGVLSIDNESTVPLTIVNRNGTQRFSPETRPWVQGMPFPIDPFYAETRHFTDCVLNDQRPTTDGHESRRSLEVVLAAARSAATGETVHIDTGG